MTDTSHCYFVLLCLLSLVLTLLLICLLFLLLLLLLLTTPVSVKYLKALVSIKRVDNELLKCL
jgi:hypothetical protein